MRRLFNFEVIAFTLFVPAFVWYIVTTFGPLILSFLTSTLVLGLLLILLIVWIMPNENQ